VRPPLEGGRSRSHPREPSAKKKHERALWVNASHSPVG
jgi:hypothetical protein